MVFQGVKDLGAPFSGFVFVFSKQFGREGMQVLAGMIEVEGAERTLLEAVFKNIPQPYASIHHHIDEAGFAKAHPPSFVLNAATEIDRLRFCRNRDDMFREQSMAFWAERGLIFKTVDDRRFNFVPVNPFLPWDVRLLSPVLAAMPCHPSIIMIRMSSDSALSEHGLERGAW